jgi:hypothetical protein
MKREMPGQRVTVGAMLLRAALSLFILLTCLRVWVGPFPILPEARAQIPDSGLQRKLLLEEAQRTNQLLSDIKRFLESGDLNVRIKGTDNQVRSEK